MIANINLADTLMLNRNNIRGTIPKTIGQSTSLVTFNVANNQLTGTFPWMFKSIPTLGTFCPNASSDNL
jgi:hypothetical protein